MIFNKIYKHEYCMNCKQENPQDREICSCGSRTFIFGDYIQYKDGRFMCECGSDKFKFAIHVNMSPVHNTTYRCEGCRMVHGVQSYSDY